MISAQDLATAFDKAGVYSLSIHKRGPNFGNKWFVQASYAEPPREWKFTGKKEQVLTSALNVSLEAALVEVLKFVPERPEIDAEEMI